MNNHTTNMPFKVVAPLFYTLHLMYSTPPSLPQLAHSDETRALIHPCQLILYLTHMHITIVIMHISFVSLHAYMIVIV